MGITNAHLLAIIDLHVCRDGAEILNGVNLAITRGSIHALLGLNGSGKSTLAYTLMGSAGYTPQRGEIWFDGENITHLSLYERALRGITLAWQEPARFEGLTVERYLGFGLPQPDPKRVRTALEAVALTPETYLRRYADESLSGGERKRVELASIFCLRPRLAILDEPDSGIDALSLSDISQLIHRMAEEGTTVLLISHRDEVVALADHASLLCDGQIVATGEPERICRRYAGALQKSKAGPKQAVGVQP